MSKFTKMSSLEHEQADVVRNTIRLPDQGHLKWGVPRWARKDIVLATLMLLASLYIGTSFGAQQEILQGRVVRIADGDTATLLLQSNKQERIRLAEIDAPESKQPFGNRSKQSLAQMCGNGPAKVKVQNRDRYGRIVGWLYCGKWDTSKEQVARGMAWVYDNYVVNAELYAIQDKARAAKQGLWVDPNPIQPWRWRKGERSGVAVNTATTGPIHGNRNSKVYHLSHCPSYNAMSPKNRVGFESEAQAQKAGYRKAGNCS